MSNRVKILHAFISLNFMLAFQGRYSYYNPIANSRGYEHSFYKNSSQKQFNFSLGNSNKSRNEIRKTIPKCSKCF